MKVLDADDVAQRLRGLAGWQLSGAEIRKTWRFPGFDDAIAFVNRVAELADAADHHPDIDIRYDRVTLALSTHSAGGLTRRDFDLATSIETIQPSPDQ